MMQKSVVIFGLLIVAAGVFWPWLSRLPFGRLPGDILIERGNVRIFLPLTTMIVISLVVSLLLWIFRR